MADTTTEDRLAERRRLVDALVRRRIDGDLSLAEFRAKLDEIAASDVGRGTSG